MTFEPETPLGHPKYEKTWIVVYRSFQKKLERNTTIWQFKPKSRRNGQGGLKVLHFWCHLKNPHPQQKNFFKCRLEDLLCVLNLWTALYPFWHTSKATCDLDVLARKFLQADFPAKVLTRFVCVFTRSSLNNFPFLEDTVQICWIAIANIYYFHKQTIPTFDRRL